MGCDHQRLPYPVDCEIPGNGGVLSWPEDCKDGELGYQGYCRCHIIMPRLKWVSPRGNRLTKLQCTISGAEFLLQGVGTKKLHRLGFTHVLVIDRDGLFFRPERYQPCGEYER